MGLLPRPVCSWSALEIDNETGPTAHIECPRVTQRCLYTENEIDAWSDADIEARSDIDLGAADESLINALVRVDVRDGGQLDKGGQPPGHGTCDRDPGRQLLQVSADRLRAKQGSVGNVREHIEAADLEPDDGEWSTAGR
jgi:hypothetical protein